MLNRLFISALVGLPFPVAAQDVSYSDFTVKQQNNVVAIGWTIELGNLCNGTYVLRSVGGGDYEQVAAIDGICGSEVKSEQYGVIDPDPVLNTENTYVLLFGFSQYSDERSIFVGYTDPSVLYIAPNPVGDQLNLRWNDADHAVYTLQVIDATGRTVLRETGLSGGSFSTDLSAVPAGLYQVVLTGSSGRVLTERIVR